MEIYGYTCLPTSLMISLGQSSRRGNCKVNGADS